VLWEAFKVGDLWRSRSLGETDSSISEAGPSGLRPTWSLLKLPLVVKSEGLDKDYRVMSVIIWPLREGWFN